MITADPFRIEVYTKMHLVEQVMVKHGRGSPNPVRYRELLEGMGIPALRRALQEPPDFRAPSLTENAGVIASADTGIVLGSARETLTLKSKLP